MLQVFILILNYANVITLVWHRKQIDIFIHIYILFYLIYILFYIIYILFYIIYIYSSYVSLIVTVSAGDAILRSIGGRMTTLTGATFEYSGSMSGPVNKRGLVATANAGNHDNYIDHTADRPK